MYGSGYLKDKYLDPLGSGLLNGAYCYSEPHTGCDIENFKLTAFKSDQQYIVNGVKNHVLLADDDHKKLFLVFCKEKRAQRQYENTETVEKELKYIILLVEHDSQNPDSKIKLTKKTTLANNIGLYDVEFDDVKVDLKSEISTKENSIKIFMDLFDSSRFMIGSICIGALRDQLGRAVDYALRTRQFERPLSDMDLVKERICKIQTRLYGMESVVYLTSGTIDSYQEADIGVESNLTKLFCTQAFNDSIRDLQDIYSSNLPDDFAELQQLGNFLSCFLNTNDVLKQYVAISCASYVGVQKAEDIRKLKDKFNHPGFMLQEYMRLRRLKKNLKNAKKSVFYLWEHVHPSLVDCADVLENSSVKMIEAMQSAFLAHGAHFVEYQLNLKRLTNIAMYVYVMNAALGRCSRSYSIGLKNTDNEKLLLNSLFYFYMRKVDFDFDELVKTADLHNLDNTVINIADKLFRDKNDSITDCLERNY
jgi:acyl-CoA dehydrogenase family protein 9